VPVLVLAEEGEEPPQEPEMTVEHWRLFVLARGHQGGVSGIVVDGGSPRRASLAAENEA
jgi:hypothetical protein